MESTPAPPDPSRPGGAPDSPYGPQAPAPPAAAPEAPEAPAGPSYAGPVPPGGWTPPAPAVPFAGAQLASWASRVAAAVLDAMILTVPAVALALLVAVMAAGSDVGAIVTGIVGLVAYLFLAAFYAPVLMARRGAGNGTTWGKQIVGIRVVRDNGQEFGLGYGFLREFVVKSVLFGFIGASFLYIPTLLDVLWPLWDDQNRALHDMVVSTHVVRA